MSKINDSFFKSKFVLFIVAVLCTAMWGSTAPAVKLGMDLLLISQNDVFSQIFFAGVCFTISGIVLLIVPFLKEPKSILVNKTNMKDTIFIGLVQTSLQYIFFYIGASNTTGFNASVLSSAGTFLIIIMSHFIYRDDKLNMNKIIGCLLGFIGIVVLSMGSCSDLSTIWEFSILGEGFILLSTFSFVITTPACKRLGNQVDPTIFTGQSFLIGGIVLSIIGILFGGRIQLDFGQGLLVTLYIGISSALAGALWNYLLKHHTLSSVSIYNFLVPLFGAIFSSVLLGEYVFEFKNLISLLCTCVGIYMVNMSEKVFRKIQKASV